jgi:hypothetical protein
MWKETGRPLASPPAHQLQARDLDVVGLEVAPHKLEVAPLQVDVVGLQPDAGLVAQGEPGDPHVAPDVAAQALDAQPPEAADLQPVGGRLDEQLRLGQQDAVAHRRQQAAEHGQGDDGDDEGDLAPGPLDGDHRHLGRFLSGLGGLLDQARMFRLVVQKAIILKRPGRC